MRADSELHVDSAFGSRRDLAAVVEELPGFEDSHQIMIEVELQRNSVFSKMFLVFNLRNQKPPSMHNYVVDLDSADVEAIEQPHERTVNELLRRH